ncbi:MAG TPA: FAD-binding oxidoreductase [Solirubrobacteraceae bacterium]
MYSTTTTALDFSQLRQKLMGAVTVPGDEAWDSARQAWNLAVDQRPVAVAEPETVADVVAVVDFARERGLRVAAQGTGHAAAPMTSLHDTILVKTHRMRVVEVDTDRRRARAQAGALWADVAIPASEHGLAALAGSSHDVGVVGYSLGGGLSWLARKHGLAANSVTAIQLVNAEGRVIVVDAHHDPDLFWALRGGGGNFGIVTAIELQLYPVAEVYAGMLAFPWERSREVLRAWREWTRDAPEEITTAARIMQIPPLPEIPEPVRGRALVVIDGAYLGDEADGADVLAPLRALGPEIDTFAMIPPAELLHIHMDPPTPVPATGDGTLLDVVPGEAIDLLVEAAGPGSGSPLLMVELRHLGGALARSGDGHGAAATLEGDFAFFAVGMALDPDMAAAVDAHVDVVKQALCEWDAGRRYLNFSERPIDTRRAYSATAYRRLQAVKTLVDPDDMFRANHPIAPID